MREQRQKRLVLKDRAIDSVGERLVRTLLDAAAVQRLLLMLQISSATCVSEYLRRSLGWTNSITRLIVADMSASEFIGCRVSPQIKGRLKALAHAEDVTESVLLRRLIDSALLQAGGQPQDEVLDPIEPVARGARLCVRLRPDDHLLLRERATARGLPSATYASMALRVHLRSVVPIPDRELDELKRSVAALSAIGRNLNQLVRLSHHTGQVERPQTSDLLAILRALEALRDRTKSLIRANTLSWENGHARAGESAEKGDHT